MSSALGFARHGLSCFQNGRWGGFRHCRFPGGLSHAASRASMQALPEVRNDGGAHEIRVRTDSFVCSGQAPPNDHPHVSLKLGKDRHVICPYCGTKFIAEHARRRAGMFVAGYKDRLQPAGSSFALAPHGPC